MAYIMIIYQKVKWLTTTLLLKWLEKKKMTSDLKYLSPASFLHNGRSLLEMNVHSSDEDPFMEDEDPIKDFWWFWDNVQASTPYRLYQA